MGSVTKDLTNGYYLWESGQQTESSNKSGNRSVNFSDYNYQTDIRNYIPENTILDAVHIAMDWKTSSILGNGDAFIRVGDPSNSWSTIGEKTQTATSWTTAWVTRSNNITNEAHRFQSGTSNSGICNQNLYAHFDCTISRKFSYNFKIWYYPSFDITVHGGTGGGRYKLGATATISPITPQGYLFSHWNDSTEKNRSFTVENNGVYTANFKPIKYYITYDLNGGIGTLPKQEVLYDTETYLLSTNDYSVIGPKVILTYNYGYNNIKFQKESYREFLQWKDKDNNNISYDNKEKIKNLKDIDQAEINLQAQWGDAIFTLPDPVRKYHKFLGWSDGNTLYPAGYKLEISSDMNLTAQWKKDHYRAYIGTKDLVVSYAKKNKKISRVFLGIDEI